MFVLDPLYQLEVVLLGAAQDVYKAKHFANFDIDEACVMVGRKEECAFAFKEKVKAISLITLHENWSIVLVVARRQKSAGPRNKGC